MSYYQHKSSEKYGRNQNYHRSNNNRSRQPKKDYINPARFIQKAKPIEENVYTSKYTFADFKLNPLIESNLQAMGYVNPSPIQDQTIPAGLEGKDIVGIANTGTGKTAAFAVPLLNKLINDPRSKAIIMAPTRELAQQIEEQCRLIAKNSKLDGALLIGGMPMVPQLRELRYNPRIIIGTPGRIKDHIERRSLSLSDCNIVVLDEVDRMLDMGFVNDITDILNKANPERQSLYFSATLDSRVKRIIEGFSVEPVHISVKHGETCDNVEQDIVKFNTNHDKIDKLHSLLNQEQVTKALIFDETQRSVEKLAIELGARGFSSDSIHGGKSQAQRQRVLKKFKNSEFRILVATDVAARGLDVSDITHVINYASPNSYEDYVHRIGRTGRAGKTGHALTFVEAN
jgi:ATP-dependent RNA helicase RhlE